ncbi:hypothetical protein M9434_004108 [Picochlorum sp. BPE23]|nr:hypothetical protein M9434_004108 [Picochlorum sp. BPE23]KAI8113694.1 hypothetical protein M9435_003688 [Picochlorum sp. BPE23]
MSQEQRGGAQSGLTKDAFHDAPVGQAPQGIYIKRYSRTEFQRFPRGRPKSPGGARGSQLHRFLGLFPIYYAIYL